MRSCFYLFALGLLLSTLVGCPAADDDDPVDDDDSMGDDDVADDDSTVDDDDDTTGAAPLVSSPADGSSIPWDGCIGLEFDPDQPAPEDLEVTAQDGAGTDLLAFTGVGGHTAMIMPTRPWPPGETVHLGANWNGGSAILAFTVEPLGATAGDPVDLGWALDLGEASACPGVESLELVLPDDHLPLVDLLGGDGQGNVQARFGYAAEDTVSQEPCIPTADLDAVYGDPLLWSAQIGPLSLMPFVADISHGEWFAVEFAVGGGPPVRTVTGAMLNGDVFDGMMTEDTCETVSEAGVPWCGRCPDAPQEECIYLFLKDIPTLDRAAPLVPRTEDEIDLDPLCL